MRSFFGFGVAALVLTAGAAQAQLNGINGLAEAPYWYADYFGRSNLTITNNGLAGIRFEDRNFTGGGFANRHHAAFAVNGVPYQFQPNTEFKLEVDVTINGPGVTEAGIWLGTAPFFPNSGNANVGQYVMLPDNGGEIAAFGGVLPFMSNNQNPFDNGNPNLPGNMARAIRNTTVHLTMVYVFGSEPSINYGINGVFTGPLRGFQNGFAGIDANSFLGVYVQGPNGNPASGDVDVTFSNLVIIPSPGAMSLLGLGGLVALRRRR